MSRRQPAVQRREALLFVLERAPNLTRAEIAASAGATISTVSAYLTLLEREGRVVSRFESHAEAETRVDQSRRSAFSRRIVRRQLRWSLKAMERAA